MAKQLSPELPWGETEFDFPAGKFHYDASEGLDGNNFRGAEKGGNTFPSIISLSIQIAE